MYRRLSHLALLGSMAVLPFFAMNAQPNAPTQQDESQIAYRGGGGGGGRGFDRGGGFDRGYDRGFDRGYNRDNRDNWDRGNWGGDYRNWDGYNYGVGVGIGVPYYYGNYNYGSPGYYGGTNYNYYEDTPYYQGQGNYNYNSGMNPGGTDTGDAW